MILVLQIILVLLLVVLGLLLLVVLLPTRLYAAGSIHGDEPAGRVGVSWGFGLVALVLSSTSGLRLHLLGLAGIPIKPDDDQARAKKKEKKKKKKEEKKREKKRGKKKGPSAAELMEHRRTIQKILRRMLGTLALRGELSGELGLEGPDTTAWLFLVLENSAARIPGFSFEVIPRYDWPTTELDGRISLRIWIPGILGTALGLLLERDVRQLLRALR